MLTVCPRHFPCSVNRPLLRFFLQKRKTGVTNEAKKHITIMKSALKYGKKEVHMDDREITDLFFARNEDALVSVREK